MGQLIILGTLDVTGSQWTTVHKPILFRTGMGTFACKTFNPEDDIPDLTGKVIIVTGGNTGIGYATIKHLARKGARVYMAARNKEKAEAAISQLYKEGLGPGNGQVIWLELELSDPRNAKKMAKEFMEREKRLDVLIHNAALLHEPYEILPDGVQLLMTVNIISPFVLTRELLSVLKKTASEPDSDVRVVVVSSEGHRVMSHLPHFRTIDDLNNECNHSWIPAIFLRYCLTKLAGILYASELHRRLSSDPSLSNITALSLHPGWVNTWCNKPWVVRYHLSNVVYVTGLPVSDVPEIGAYTSVFAAAAPAVKREREKFGGAHIEPIGKVVKPSVGLWKAVTMRREAMVGEEMEEEWVERGKELWEVIERFLEERGI